MLWKLFDSEGLAPHGYCLLWQSELFWTQAVADGLIAISYYSISAALFVYLVRRKDVFFRWTGVLFSIFILACATSHVMDIWTLWYADYGVQAVVKIVTAAVSLLTAAALWPLLPRALAMPSIAKLEEANWALNAEIAERRLVERSLRLAEEQLRKTQEELEGRSP